MDTVTRIETSDGQIFKTEQQAKKHINKLIGDKLSPLCHKLSGLKWSELPECIMANLGTFSEITDLNNDLILYNEDGDKVPD